MPPKNKNSGLSSGTRRINGRPLLILLAVLIPMAVAIHFIHAFMVERSAQNLLRRANELRAEGELKESISHLQKYVRFVPDDLETLVTLGETLEQIAETPQDHFRVYLTFEEVVRRDPQRDELRRRIATMAIEKLGRFDDAQTHLEVLLETFPDDGELQYQFGLCEQAQRKFHEAATWYQSAIDDGYHEVPAYAQLARLQGTRLDQPDQAAATIEAMVEANPDSSEALLVRAEYRSQLGSLDTALEDAQRAQELGDDDVDATFFATELAAKTAAGSRPKLLKVRERVEKALEKYPDDERFYHVLSTVHFGLGEPDAAIAAIRLGKTNLPDNVDLAWVLADLLISNGETEAAQEEIKKARELDDSEAFPNYLEARILKSGGDLIRAAQRLEEVLTQVDRENRLSVLARIQLGDCYRLMGDFERQLEEYRRILDIDPLSVSGGTGAASALLALGRTREALTQYRLLIDAPTVALQVAKILFQQNLQLAQGERNWDPVDDVLARVAADASDQFEAELLRVEVLNAKGQRDRAQELLEELQKSNPEAPTISAALSRIAMQGEQWDEATRILDEAEKRLGDRVALRVARADYLALRGEEDADARLFALEQGLEQFTSAEQQGLLQSLAAIRLRRSESAARQRVWKKLAALRPDHVRDQFRLYELSLQVNDDDGAKRARENLKRVEGAEGSHVRASKVLRIIETSTAEQTEALEEARSLLKQIAVQRPGWDFVPIGEARIDQLLGDDERATENYLRAIELGNRDPTLLRRAIELLTSRQMYAEADQLLAQLRESMPSATNKRMGQLAAQVSLLSSDFDRALSLAKESISPDSKDERDHIWLARMQAAAGQPKQAEASLRNAVELAPGKPGPRVMLVQFLVRSDEKDKAETEIENAKQALPPETAPLALALCYEMVSKLDLAEESYQAVLKAKPEDGATLQALAAFYLRTKQAVKAEPLLRKFIDPQSEFSTTQQNRARRALATTIAGKDYAHFLEALALLDVETDDPGNALANRRLKARLLATRSRRQNLRKAIEILEALERDESLAAADEYLLAKAYDAADERQKADRRWQNLVATNEKNANFLAEFVARSLQNDRFDEAERSLEKLKKLQTSAFITQALSARLLVLRDQPGPAIQLLRSYVENEQTPVPNRIDRVDQVARLLIELVANDTRIKPEASGQLAREAERWFHEVIPEKPQSSLPLIVYLGKRGRLDEALDVCGNLQDSPLKLNAIAAGITAVREAGAEQKHVVRLDEWLTAFIQAEPDSLVAVLQLAQLRDLMGRYEEAELYYQSLLKAAPRNFIVLNNLAWLLSVHAQRHDDAEKMVDQAIEIAGPNASLLDTRATILLNQKRTDEAIEALRESVAQNDTPLTQYHLAQALHQGNDSRAARLHFRKATLAGLTVEKIHALEKDVFLELAKLYSDE